MVAGLGLHFSKLKVSNETTFDRPPRFKYSITQNNDWLTIRFFRAFQIIPILSNLCFRSITHFRQ